MIRVLVFLIAVAALAFGVVWLADRPGDVVVTWLGYHAETSITVAVAALAALVVGAILVWSLLRALVRAPGAMSRARRERRAARAHRALSRGLVAIGAGDAQAARRFAAEARRLAPAEPLALLLAAQSAQIAGDREAAERTFRDMTTREDTKLLGLHGLFVEAQRRDDPAAARAYAEEAVKTDPSLAWAGQAVLEFRCAESDWVGALAALDANMRSGLTGKETYRRQRAVLLTGRALSRDTDRDTAKTLVLEAVKLCPNLVPAAALAGRLHAEAGDARKAARVIEAAWAVNPHPDLAQAYAHIYPGDSARERLTRMRTLARLNDHPEAAFAVARAAVDAQEFAVARQSLAPLLPRPTQRVAALMAELEEAESGNVGAAREWMARALHAGRDPAWTADGLVSDRWIPVSPATGHLDAFQWKVPLAELAAPGPVIDHHEPLPVVVVSPPPQPAPPPPAPPAATEPTKPPAPVEPARPAAAATPAPPPAPAAAAPVASPAGAAGAGAGVGTGATPIPLTRRSGPRPVEDVIPLIHAPDDPGPEPERAAAPEPDAERWRGLKSLFK